MNFRKLKSFEIYTDGSHKGRWGSWAYVILQNNQVIKESSGRVRKTNSNRMEFQAVIEALKTLPKGSAAKVYTDCMILIEATQKIPDWQSNQWKKSNQTEIANVDLIQSLSELMGQNKLSWHWIKGHRGITHNERCDQLCTLAREV